MVLPLQPGAAGRHPLPKGLLFVDVLEATNIPNLDWRSLLSKPDTFFECASRFSSFSSLHGQCISALDAAEDPAKPWCDITGGSRMCL